jgi:hypothetical protein
MQGMKFTKQSKHRNANTNERGSAKGQTSQLNDKSLVGRNTKKGGTK